MVGKGEKQIHLGRSTHLILSTIPSSPLTHWATSINSPILFQLIESKWEDNWSAAVQLHLQCCWKKKGRKCAWPLPATSQLPEKIVGVGELPFISHIPSVFCYSCLSQKWKEDKQGNGSRNGLSGAKTGSQGSGDEGGTECLCKSFGDSYRASKLPTPRSAHSGCKSFFFFAYHISHKKHQKVMKEN